MTPRIVNKVSCVQRINDECYFWWQAEYLAKLKCHCSWQAQYWVRLDNDTGWSALVFNSVVLRPICCVLNQGK